MTLGGTRPLGGIRGWSEGIGDSLGVGSGGKTSPGGIFCEFRGTRSPAELEEGLREYQIPRGCRQGLPEARFPGGHLLGQARPRLGVPRGNWGGRVSPGGTVHRTAALTVGSLKAQPGRKGRPGPGSELMAAEERPPRPPATPSPRQPPAQCAGSGWEAHAH